MATIWFLKRGPHAAEKPVNWCVSHLGLMPENWIAPLGQKGLSLAEKRPELGPDGDLRFVIVAVTEDDPRGKSAEQWKPGFYLLDIPVREARQILQRAA